MPIIKRFYANVYRCVRCILLVYSSWWEKQVYFSYLLSLARQGVEYMQSFSYFQLDPQHLSILV